MSQSTDDFLLAVRKLLKMEGGFAPDDRGRGAVNMGITQYFLSLIGDKRKPADLTRDEVIELYLEHFWLRYRIGEFRHQPLREQLLFALVNLGAPRPIVYLQRAYNISRNNEPRIAADGVIGPKTIAAVNGYPWQSIILDAFKDQMENEYRRMAGYPKYANDLNGWLARLGRKRDGGNIDV